MIRTRRSRRQRFDSVGYFWRQIRSIRFLCITQREIRSLLMNEFDAQLPSFGLDRDFRGISPLENLIFSLRLLLGVQIIYEYCISFNAFVLFLRIFQTLLIIQGTNTTIPLSIRAQERKERLLNGVVSILHVPVVLFQIIYRKMEPLIVIFIGRAMPASVWQILLQDLLVIALCYTLINFRPADMQLIPNNSNENTASEL